MRYVACVRKCVSACVSACVRACFRELVGKRERGRDFEGEGN
jgi:hypothetical protein